MKHRSFIKLSFVGSEFSGWQIQPNAPTVQARIEQALSLLYNKQISIVGCGRTDAGVHASEFYAHVDLDHDRIPPAELRFKLNGLLPESIAIQEIMPVLETAHARFDATRRKYIYKLSFKKDPFQNGLTYRFDQAGMPDFNLMQAAAAIVGTHSEFYPFCKSHTDVETFSCQIFESRWEQFNTDEWAFHISANRFLRGMVRLIVGMCINVGLGRIDLAKVEEAFANQTRLKRAWSVPAQGLYLSEIKYPYL